MKRIILFIILFAGLVSAQTEIVIGDNPDNPDNINNNPSNSVSSSDVAILRSDIAILNQKLEEVKVSADNSIKQQDIEAIKGDFFAEMKIYVSDFFMKLLIIQTVFFVFVLTVLFLFKSKRLI